MKHNLYTWKRKSCAVVWTGKVFPPRLLNAAVLQWVPPFIFTGSKFCTSMSSVFVNVADAYPKKGAPKDEPPGEGPILRWQTRVVLSPGGDAFHPKNRKVKVSVYVKELELTPVQKERLLFMVGKRYNPNKDELTIVSERYCLLSRR